MNIQPILTEKSLNEAKNGVYSFWVLPKLTKGQIKVLVSDLFDVKVKKVRTLNYKKTFKKNWKGVKTTKKARKKALVTLKEGEIEIFKTEK